LQHEVVQLLVSQHFVSQHLVSQHLLVLQEGLQHESPHATLCHRLTHTSSGTHTFTFLQTVQGTHSLTVYGTFTVTV